MILSKEEHILKTNEIASFVKNFFKLRHNFYNSYVNVFSFNALSHFRIQLLNETNVIFITNDMYERSRCGAAETTPTRNREVAGLIPGLAPWVKDPALP